MPIEIYDISLRWMTRCLISPLWFSCVVGVFQIALESPSCILALLLFSEVETCLKQSISYLYGIFINVKHEEKNNILSLKFDNVYKYGPYEKWFSFPNKRRNLKFSF